MKAGRRRFRQCPQCGRFSLDDDTGICDICDNRDVRPKPAKSVATSGGRLPATNVTSSKHTAHSEEAILKSAETPEKAADTVKDSQKPGKATAAFRRKIEVEADSLEDARRKLRSQIPEGLNLLSERILSKGEERIIQGAGETFDAAMRHALERKPADAKVIKKEQFPILDGGEKAILVEANDEETAKARALDIAIASAGATIESTILERSIAVRSIILKTEGKEESSGKRKNTYEVKIHQPVVVQVTVKSEKARIEGTIGTLKHTTKKIREEDRVIDKPARGNIGDIADLIKAINTLDGMSGSRYVDLRKPAAEALGRMGTEAKEAVPSLKRLLMHSLFGSFATNAEAEVAARALGEIGPEAREAVPDLIDALNIYQDKRKAFNYIQYKEKSKDILRTCLAAAEALARIGTAAREAIPSLVSLSKSDEDWTIRLAAVKALDKMGPEAMHGLVEISTSGKDQRIRESAAETLIKYGQAAVPALIEALKQQDSNVREYSADTLARIGQAAVPALIEALKQQDSDVREYSADALVKIGQAAVPAITKELAFSKWRIRRRLKNILSEIKPTISEATATQEMNDFGSGDRSEPAKKERREEIQQERNDTQGTQEKLYNKKKSKRSVKFLHGPSNYWRCPNCKGILKKGGGLLGAIDSERIRGSVNCGGCGAGFRRSDVYGGVYDLPEVQVDCPSCGTTFRAPVEMVLGKSCPICNHTLPTN